MAKLFRELAGANARHDKVLRAAVHERYLALRTCRATAVSFAPGGTAAPDRARSSVQIEAVHDMRVWAKRTREVLRMLRDCRTVKGTKPALGIVDRLNDALSALRDSDVMIEVLKTELQQAPDEEKPGIRWLIRDRQRRRREVFPIMVVALGECDEATLDALIEDVCGRPVANGSTMGS